MADNTLKAKVEIEVDTSKTNKAIDQTTQQLKTKLSNMGDGASKAASSAMTENVIKISSMLERGADRISKILEKGLKFGTGLASGSLVAFLKNGSAEALKFQVKLDNLKAAYAGIGEKLFTQVTVRGKTGSEWIDTLTSKLNSLDVSSLQKMVDYGIKAGEAWAWIKGLQLSAGAVKGIAEISKMMGLGSTATSGLAGAAGAGGALAGSSALTGAAKWFAGSKYARMASPLLSKIPYIGGTAISGAIPIAGTGLAAAAGSYDYSNRTLKESTGESLNWNNIGRGLVGTLGNLFSGRFSSIWGAGKPTNQTFTDNIGLTTDRASESTDIFKRYKAQQESLRKMNEGFNEQNLRYVGEAPLSERIKRQSDIRAQIKMSEDIQTSIQAQLLSNPKNETLNKIRDEEIKNRTDLIKQLKEIVSDTEEYKKKQREVNDNIEKIKGKSADQYFNYLVESSANRKRATDLTASYNESRNRVGVLNMGASITDIPNIISERLNTANSEIIQLSKEHNQYLDELRAIAIEGNAIKKQQLQNEIDAKAEMKKQREILAPSTGDSLL